MLGDIVRDALAGQPDMELVGDLVVCAGEDVPAVISNSRADVLVVGRELWELGRRDLDLLCECLDTTVLVVTQDGRRAFRYELRPERIPLATEADGVSPQHLVDAIRQAARRRLPEA